MTLRTLTATALAACVLVAAPAFAGDRTDKIGKVCTTQQVHTPAGKMVHNAPIKWCKDASEVAQNDKAYRAPDKAPVARD